MAMSTVDFLDAQLDSIEQGYEVHEKTCAVRSRACSECASFFNDMEDIERLLTQAQEDAEDAI